MSYSPFDIRRSRGACYVTWYARRKVWKLAGQYGWDADDLVQELSLHILCQWSRYDPSKGQPTTFIQNVIDTKVCELIRYQLAAKRDFRRNRQLSAIGRAAEYGRLDGVRGQPALSDFEQADLRMDFAEIIQRLPAQLQSIAELLKTQTPSAIARKLNLPESRVRKRIAELREHFVAAGYGDA